MSQTPQDPQPLQQTVEFKQYHAPELRDYGTVQELTEASQAGTPSDNNTAGVNNYITGVP
jgi:hypothetical protein